MTFPGSAAAGADQPSAPSRSIHTAHRRFKVDTAAPFSLQTRRPGFWGIARPLRHP